MSRGYVYILINSLMPDILKIGKTTLHPNERAKQLRTTGVPVHFSVAYFEEFMDCEEAERKMHEELKDHRTSSDREFFTCPLKDAITLLQNLKNFEPKLVENLSENDDEIDNHERNKLFTPSEDLSKVVGAAPMTRSDIISAVWRYIKKNNLQDPCDRKYIICNGIIKSTSGSSSISMLELAGWVRANILECK